MIATRKSLNLKRLHNCDNRQIRTDANAADI